MRSTRRYAAQRSPASTAKAVAAQLHAVISHAIPPITSHTLCCPHSRVRHTQEEEKPKKKKAKKSKEERAAEAEAKQAAKEKKDAKKAKKEAKASEPKKPMG